MKSSNLSAYLTRREFDISCRDLVAKPIPIFAKQYSFFSVENIFHVALVLSVILDHFLFHFSPLDYTERTSHTATLFESDRLTLSRAPFVELWLTMLRLEDNTSVR